MRFTCVHGVKPMSCNYFCRYLIIATAAAVQAFQLSSQPAVFAVRTEDSHIGFSVSKWGVFKEEGRFRDFEGTIEFDPADPEGIQVFITIRAASIDSRNDRRDNALRSRDFFYVSRYPLLTFRSALSEKSDDATILVEGDLTIRGVTRRVDVPVTILGINRVRDLGTLAGFEANFTIDREDFGVGLGWSIIGREVDIQMMIGAVASLRTAKK